MAQIVVPGNIHTQSVEVHNFGNCEGIGGIKSQSFKEIYEAKMEFQEGWASVGRV